MAAALASLVLSNIETDAEGMLTDPGQIFAAFADLDLGAETIARMRTSPTPPRQPEAGSRWRRIVAVMDGDTLTLEGGVTVRLIGVDAPESDSSRKLREDIYKTSFPIRERDMIRLGEAATDFTRSLALGKYCWLEHDGEPQDQYGRTLAYVHLEDGRILNEELIAQGFGKAYLSYSFAYRQRYVLLQTEAKLRERGLWARKKEDLAGKQDGPIQRTILTRTIIQTK